MIVARLLTHLYARAPSYHRRHRRRRRQSALMAANGCSCSLKRVHVESRARPHAVDRVNTPFDCARALHVASSATFCFAQRPPPKNVQARASVNRKTMAAESSRRLNLQTLAATAATRARERATVCKCGRASEHERERERE